MKLFLRRQLLPSVLCLCLLACLPLVARTGMASTFHFKSRYYIDLWESQLLESQLRSAKVGSTQNDGAKRAEANIAEDQFVDALAAARRAHELDADNPHYQLTLANVMEWGAYARLTELDIHAADSLYRAAIARRPNWPNAYGDYGYNLAFFQGDLAGAWPQLELGLKYGPYTREVLRQLLVVGFAYWGELSAAQKRQVLQAASIMLSADDRSFQVVKTFARQYQLTGPVCAYVLHQAEPLSPARRSWLQRDLCRSA